MTKYYFLWCDSCYKYTQHEIIDGEDNIQTIKCLECETIFELSILHERVKVFKFIKECYDRRKSERREETEKTS